MAAGNAKLVAVEESNVLGSDTTKIEVAVSWDFISGQQPVDLDVSCVLVNDVGNILDCAFYNNLKLADGSVVHSGDNKTGVGEGDDEVITVDLSSISDQVKALVFVVNCYSGGSFAALETAQASVRDAYLHTPLLEIPPIGSLGDKTALTLCILYREEKNVWKVKNVSQTSNGRNFKECEPVIRTQLEFVIPRGLQQEGASSPNANKVFKLEKGGAAYEVPSATSGVFMGLGWDTGESGIDVDASCLIFDYNGQHSTNVYFGNKNAPGISHGGDNLTGAGEGDDEVIQVELNQMPGSFGTLVFVVNVYSSGKTFSDVQNCFCRLVDKVNGKELCRYSLTSMESLGRFNGLVMCKMTRNGASWKVQAIGEPANGRVANELVSTAITFVGKTALGANPTQANPTPSKKADGGCITM